MTELNLRPGPGFLRAFEANRTAFRVECWDTGRMTFKDVPPQHIDELIRLAKLGLAAEQAPKPDESLKHLAAYLRQKGGVAALHEREGQYGCTMMPDDIEDFTDGPLCHSLPAAIEASLTDAGFICHHDRREKVDGFRYDTCQECDAVLERAR
jgi:hypothetical protein